MRILAILCAVALAGCMSTKLQPVVNSCPPIVAYSPDFQHQAGDELAEIKGIAPHIAQMIVDYGAERKALRTCQ